jgi:hypothetical protein
MISSSNNQLSPRNQFTPNFPNEQQKRLLFWGQTLFPKLSSSPVSPTVSRTFELRLGVRPHFPKLCYDIGELILDVESGGFLL